jgi:hypothetical protein
MYIFLKIIMVFFILLLKCQFDYLIFLTFNSYAYIPYITIRNLNFGLFILFEMYLM